MKRVFYIYLLLIFLSCLPGLTFAQSKVMIRGVVTSTSDKSTLPGANIQLINKDGRVVSYAVTDMDGNYSLMSDMKNGDKLVVTYAGFQKQTLTVNNRTKVDIALVQTDVMIEGAVVVGRKKVSNGMMNINERDLTTAATTIGLKDLAELTGASVEDALQGRIAGVDIVASSGTPGAGMSIRIRGTTSINGSSQPLIIVDGFPYETTISSDFDFANADEEEYSQMLNIAPDDIKEITVLKDAAATAIWGSRAANGVLQITTKRGAVSKPRVSYSFKGSIDKLPRGIPTLSGDQYNTLIQDEMMNSGIAFNPNTYPEFANDVNNPYYFYNYGQNTNWFDEVTRTGFTQDHNISISGGGDKAQYRASVGYYNQQGTTIGTDFTRISTRLNVDYNVSEKLKFQASMSYTHGENNRNYISYLSNSKDVGEMAYTKMPNMSVYEYNALGLLTGNYFSPLESPQGYWNSTSQSGIYNPVAMANEGLYKSISDRIIPNLTLVWTPFTFLRYQFDVGFDVMNNKNNAFLPQTATGRPWNEISVNRADDVDGEAFTIQTYNKLIFTPNLGEKHDLQVLLGTSTNDKSSASYKSTTGNNASPYLKDPSIASRVAGQSVLGIYSGSSQNRSVSFFANAQYSLLDRYIVSGNIRTDGSSRFGRSYRWGSFPSISARWRISGEPFMKGLKWLDELSLRASYGVNGNAPKSDFGHISTYGIYDYNYLGSAGTYPNNLELIDLRWERSIQKNFGVNFAAFNNRFNVDFELYKKRTNDLFFYGLDIPTSTGFSSVDMNVGVMDNQGWELSVMTTPVKTKDFTFSFNFNIARNENFVRSISEQYPMESGVSTANGSYIRRFEIDQPLGSFYGYKYNGVYLNKDQTIARDKNGGKIFTYNDAGERVPVQMRFGYPSIDYQFQEGDAKYEDLNHDGNIDYLDIVYLGNANPLFQGGFGPSFRYKNFTLNLYFNYRYGNDIVNSAKMNMENMYSFNNQSTAVLNRWRHSYENEADAPEGLLPRALYKKGYNYLGSDRFIEDGSFLRFKSLTFKYTFDRKMLAKTFLNDASIYLTMQNLFVWTNYTGQDPEVSVGGSDPFKTGYDYATTPRSKEYTLGLSLTF
ncbi:TonB-linked outer membrane protein, SusC/RagA family [Bacteroides luti]|uniref:TonB-linked outer membrane protein, SusC/RagA family n=1 Tax=Bacteroides luti TaxID=1297750 RepID=A0A1M5F0U1_9BACE|nr:TonB-dependent receptor [Bacteroides luti]SHF85170.1 TonB-linked outer membrane protein, SusC/RagA family [Bacteroides luti]